MKEPFIQHSPRLKNTSMLPLKHNSSVVRSFACNRGVRDTIWRGGKRVLDGGRHGGDEYSEKNKFGSIGMSCWLSDDWLDLIVDGDAADEKKEYFNLGNAYISDIRPIEFQVVGDFPKTMSWAMVW